MKKNILIIVLLLSFTNIFATNYYISSSSGNDSNDGKSENSAWKTISKLNTIIKTLGAGDVVLFKSGDTFSGSISLTTAGSSGSPITFSSYGSGERPIITGFIPVTDWVNNGGNIWSKTISGSHVVSALQLNGNPQKVGRYPKSTEPNRGYYTVKSSTQTSITGNDLPPTNWTGAEIVIRTVPWAFEMREVTSQSNGTVKFNPTTAYLPRVNAGFFFQHDPRACTSEGEWSFNKKTRLLSIYSTIDPNTLDIQITGYDNLIDLYYYSHYITIENLYLKGAGINLINEKASNFIEIKNCELAYSGGRGIHLETGTNAIIDGNYIHDVYANAIASRNNYQNASITNNTIEKVALVAGMGVSGVKTCSAISIVGSNTVVNKNVLRLLGYIGISWTGDNATITYNKVSFFCAVLDDGAGIYSYDGADQYPNILQSKVLYNIVDFGFGAEDGSSEEEPVANGIYMDDGSNNVEIKYNTVSNIRKAGIYIHNSNNIDVQFNTVYRSGSYLLYLYNDSLHPNTITGCTFKNNILVATTTTQKILFVHSQNGDFLTNVFDNNYYCKPYNENEIINLWYNNGSGYRAYAYSLSEWKTAYKLDLNTKLAPITLDPKTQILRSKWMPLDVNDTMEPQEFTLNDSYVDVNGVYSPSSFILEPFTSKILFRKENENPIKPPVAVNDTISVLKNTTYTSSTSLIDNDYDPNSLKLSVTAGTFSSEKDGNIVLKADGSYVYTPQTNFTGEDTFIYTLTNGTSTDSAKLVVNVINNNNSAPVALNDAITLPVNASWTSKISLMQNDYDPDGDEISVIPGTFPTNQGGSLTVSSDGLYTYVPKTNFIGEDTVDYTITDGSLTSTAKLIVTLKGPNNAPVAVNDFITVPENTSWISTISLMDNDYDPDGDEISVIPGTFSTNQGGSLTVTSDGLYTYIPKTNFIGEDTVDYTITDGSLTSMGKLFVTIE
ncbi:Ig-like domain-containing protein, partial [Lutibacter sp. HS1-25]|uniref:Ig-like domain-containing protein n=1 Tax=Lutibacter sp. HS1-25 TaxID=2485000 RepID=UPI0010106EF7